MKFKNLLFFIIFLTFSSCEENSLQQLEDFSTQQNKEVIEKINNLAQEIMNLVEPILKTAQASNSNDDTNTYYLSFIKKDLSKPNSKEPMSLLQLSSPYDPYRKMTVNNNFNGEKLTPTQVFLERGHGKKHSPSHNVQMMNENFENEQVE
ncbi:hypothetical protein PVAND_017022 [Polypedilum vanderplanki]|uniref:Lipoprotein n=1 Tax=Polypedilum vanderplanki TaxID=319348 RepID=A0A9J6BI57_POLVA|nr:hypothetical protein PVAND_017022 [Polypedilum vanderplanki]